MRNARRMEALVTTAGFKWNEISFLVLTAVVAAGTSLAVFLACFYWLRLEQGRFQKKIFKAMSDSHHDHEEMFLTGKDPMAHGELVARFKVNQGKRVVSILESDGRRFIHVDGELSALERERMVRYLKSEGFMS